MPKIAIAFEMKKTVVLTGSVEIDVDDDTAKHLQDPSHLESWALYTMLGLVPEWKEEPGPAYGRATFKASIDGKPFEKGAA